MSHLTIYTVVLWLGLAVCANTVPGRRSTTRFYDFKVTTRRITKLCKTKDIVTVNGMYPGPIVYAREDGRVIVKVTNETPYNVTIHWHGVRQRMSCWFDGPAYITQCPIQAGKSFTYNFTFQQQKGTFFWHAHVSWLRGTVYGAIITQPKNAGPFPLGLPYKERIIILGEYWLKDLQKLEKQVLASGGGPPPADAFTINGHPGPNYDCSRNDVYKIDVIPGQTYLLRIINAGLNTENFFGIANHKLTIIEVDAEYTKPFTVERVMLGPGQTMNALVTADQPIGRYIMAMGPYMSAHGVPFQKKPSVAYLQYLGALPNSITFLANLPNFNDHLAVTTIMDGLRSLNPVNIPKKVDESLFFTIGLNIQKCKSQTPGQSCQGINNGVFAASMNNVTFVNPSVSLLEAYYNRTKGHYTEDFPEIPLNFYDFVDGAPNDPPNDTQSMIGTRIKVLEYGTRVQLILQDTGTVGTENHPIHLHGYSFYVVGYGTGNYNPTARLNLVDPPLLNTIGVPAGGWAAIRFTANNPGVWLMHCHLEIHLSWGLSMAFIVKNGKREQEILLRPPAEMPRC